MLPSASVLITYAFLALAILAAWCPCQIRRRALLIRPWVPLYAAALLSALLSGVLHGLGLAAVGALAWLAYTDAQGSGPLALRIARGIALVVLSAALAAHIVPGFDNALLLRDHRFSPDAAPYTQYANFDKGSMGLLLLVFCCAQGNASIGWRAAVVKVLPVLAGTCAVVITAALLLGYTRLDVKLPSYTPVFLAVNLLFTCVAEEALFRGILQQRLTAALRARALPWAGSISVLCSALVFGAAHAGGGWGYALLATLAGVGYGLAYHRSGRIEAAILVHFSVNATHFIGFTYPRLA